MISTPISVRRLNECKKAIKELLTRLVTNEQEERVVFQEKKRNLII